MATAAGSPPDYGLIAECSPAPCDASWPHQFLAVSLRDYAWWVLVLFIVAAFFAGRRISRKNLALPVIVLTLIAATIYEQFAGEMRLHHYHFSVTEGLGLPPELRKEHAVLGLATYLVFAIVPFVVGAALSLLKRRKQKAIHAQD